MAHKTPEKKVQEQIEKYLKPYTYEYGGPVYLQRRSPSDPTYKNGSADLFCVIHGVHIEIEVKAPGGTRRPDQERWERICKQIGAPYIVCDNLHAFVEFIQSYL